MLRALKKVAKDADELVIATDYDREGELIGLEALREVARRQPGIVEGADLDGDVRRHPRPAQRIKRARYSALTKEEIERAFATSTSSPSRSPTPAPRARTSTCSGARR